MKKKVVTALTVLTIIGETLVNVPNIAFAVDEIEAKDKKINELSAQESEMERNIQVVERQIADLEAEVDRLQGELEDAQRDLDRLEREMNELNDRINKRHKRIEKNARALQLNKNGVWLNYLKVVFDKKSNWGQKISALTSISRVMSNQKGLIEQQERDYTTLQNKEVMANERIVLIKGNMSEINRAREELERLQADLEVQKLELAARRTSAEDEKGVLIAKKEAAQAAQREVAERQKRVLSEERERAAAAQQNVTVTPQSTSGSQRRPAFTVIPTLSTSSGSGYSDGMQCTDYATAKTGIGGLGNAAEWVNNAQNKGYDVSKTAQPGDVAVFAPRQAGASSYGHVAVVDVVNPDGSIGISETNYNGGFNKRTISQESASGYVSRK
ncbi:MAG: CHAP domain-containing protein [Lactobacillales bacterium]|jgi:peptidoglycan hydrolase CwlO-like protein|nr:CHAP domain-containing protein [Lactobacillales bacterium]